MLLGLSQPPYLCAQCSPHNAASRGSCLALQGRQAPHAAVSAAGCPPFIAWEECREHLGRHPCDQRRALSHYRAGFPAVDFSLVSAQLISGKRCPSEACVRVCTWWFSRPCPGCPLHVGREMRCHAALQACTRTMLIRLKGLHSCRLAQRRMSCGCPVRAKAMRKSGSAEQHFCAGLWCACTFNECFNRVCISLPPPLWRCSDMHERQGLLAPD